MQHNATPATHSYALLDCALHDGAFQELRTRFAQVRWHSLFQGTPEQELLEASPLLLAIASQPMDEELARWLGAFERAAPSVSWIESPHSLPTLGAMLTSRMRCHINDGEEVILRFWDPRILLGLPTALDAEQRRHFFAPITQWIAFEPRREQYYRVPSPPDAAPVPRYLVKPISLTEAQRAQLMYYDKEYLYDDIIAHWRATTPDAIVNMEPAMLREIAIAACARCSSYGIHAPSDHILFAGLMFAVSPSFDDHPAMQRALRDEAVAPDERLERAIEALPDAVWDQIENNKRYDALFEHQPMASGAGTQQS